MHIAGSKISKLPPSLKKQRFNCLTVIPSLLAALISISALAESPPDMPLPACEDQGACPQINDNVGGLATGQLSANTATPVSVVPNLPVCDYHHGYPPYEWAPEPCYSAVHKPVIQTCGYIDLGDDNKWKEGSCANALFRNPGDAVYPMFTVEAAPSSSGCGGAGNYQTYAWGGPANVAGAKWVEFGPTRLDCQVTFNGPRPDGLYGPTWVKMRVGIDRAETGDERRGNAEYASFYVPIDGDLREDVVDVELLATSTQVKNGDALIVTYTISLTNEGEKEAENVQLIASFPQSAALGQDPSGPRITKIPPQLHVISAPESYCGELSSFVGGTLICSDITLADKDDPLGRNVEFIDVKVRVTNASDLPTVYFEAIVPGDVDDSDNEDYVTINTGLSGGSTEQTRQLMEVLAPYFNYQTDLRQTACNSFRLDIYARLERIRLDHPEVFDQLAYGPVTSGDYFTGVSWAGHVGIVVYPKGTDYHQTGVIIHGTPSVSPLGALPETFDTQAGTFPMGEEPAETQARGTTNHGYYYRTPIQKFPGHARPEKDGCGFEGLYSNNEGEFDQKRLPTCVAPAASSGSCPIDPDAFLVVSESPVEIQVSNANGKQVVTQDGKVVTQDFEDGIHSIAVPHDDGTYGWTLVLPPDDYEVKLTGVDDGPYTLTVTRFGRLGEPIETVIDGTASPGSVDIFEFIDKIFRDGYEK